jgi:hypothetical protein
MAGSRIGSPLRPIVIGTLEKDTLTTKHISADVNRGGNHPLLQRGSLASSSPASRPYVLGCSPVATTKRADMDLYAARHRGR